MEYFQETIDETFNRNKTYFRHFFENEDGYGNYSERIRAMMNRNYQRLIVDLNDLREYDSSFVDQSTRTQENIVTRMLQHPMDYIPPMEAAIKESVLSIDSLYGSKAQEQRSEMDFFAGFEGDFGNFNVNPRGLLASFLCQMVCVHGIVTKCSAVRPKVVKSVHYCAETKQMLSREYRDSTSLSGMPTSSVYPSRDENGNSLESEFGLCQYKDYQVMSIQEAPETAPLGQLPRSCDVIVENDLVDKCKPGDRIRIVGVFRAMSGKTAAMHNAVFRTVLIANNVQILGKEVNGITMTTEDLLNVREFAKREDAFSILARSVAPSIYGHSEIKEALLLQLLGGVEKNLENGTHLRGDVNILMVGDPSTAKSQLLRFIRTIAPLAINTNGRGSSGVGLTAAVTLDPETKEKRLEAGAMVLADRGIVCIDEFDKMSEVDRVAIHEVMEQQTVTIAKAGIHATLNARCSVLAAANPVYGQYDRNKKAQENIGLPDSLLSRFDLLFVVLDKLDREADRNISNHILRMHRYVKPGENNHMNRCQIESSNSFPVFDSKSAKTKESIFQKFDPLLHGGNYDKHSNRAFLTIDFLKKFIYYAKTRFQPVLTDKAIDLIAEGYAELRSQQNAKTLAITARSLETLIRLASAHAKSRLSKAIEEIDAEKAMSLLSFALYHDTFEVNPIAAKSAQTARNDLTGQKRNLESMQDKENQVPLDQADQSKITMEQLNTLEKMSRDHLGEKVRSVLNEILLQSRSDRCPVKEFLSEYNKRNRTCDQFTLDAFQNFAQWCDTNNYFMYVHDRDEPDLMLF